MVHAHPERQQVCERCQGLGWVRDSEHVCTGHAPCRNAAALCNRRITEPEPSLWRELEQMDRRELRARKPELLVTIVQARNLPVRDLWKGTAAYGWSEPLAASQKAFFKDRSASRFVDRYESCNTSCVVSLFAEHGRVQVD